MYDDNTEILENIYIRDLKNIKQAFVTSSWAFLFEADTKNISNYYRPTQVITYMLLYAIDGSNPKIFHIYKIILHIICTTLVYFICLEISKNSSKSFLAGLLFAVHPMHTEAVTWISGITDVNCTLFVLVSFLYFIKFNYAKKYYHYFLSLIFFFAGMLSKETAVMIIPLIAIYEFIWGKKIPFFSIKVLSKYSGYIVFLGLYFTMRIKAIGSFVQIEKYEYLTGFQVFLNVFPLILRYFEKLLFPLSFSAFYEFHPVHSAFDPLFIFSFLLVCSIIYIICYLRRNKISQVFFFCWILVTILPVLHCKKLGLNVFTERYLYLPSVGFCILMAEIIFWIMKLTPKKTMIYCLCGVLITFYFVQTLRRNPVWKDNLTLFSNTVKDAPDSYIIQMNLGIALTLENRYTEALVHFNEALRLNPESAKIHYNMGTLLLNVGKFWDAIQHFLRAINIRPDYADAHNNLATAAARSGNYELAVKHYLEAVRLKPNLLDAHFNLGNVYMKFEKYNEAIDQFNEVIRLDPNNVEAYRKIGTAWYYMDQNMKALEAFSRAFELSLKMNGLNHPLTKNLRQIIEKIKQN